MVSWPKGVVYEPDAMDRAAHLLTDNLGLLLSLAVLIAVAAFLFLAWRRHGKDPEAGVTFFLALGGCPARQGQQQGSGQDGCNRYPERVSAFQPGYLF